MITSTDGEKAFDKIKPCCMIKTLSQQGIQEHVFNLILKIYPKSTHQTFYVVPKYTGTQRFHREKVFSLSLSHSQWMKDSFQKVSFSAPHFLSFSSSRDLFVSSSLLLNPLPASFPPLINCPFTNSCPFSVVKQATLKQTFVHLTPEQPLRPLPPIHFQNWLSYSYFYQFSLFSIDKRLLWVGSICDFLCP